MQARALSLVDDASRAGHFPVATHGYDRTAVDAFMEHTAAERRRLEADLAQLEAAFRDLAPRRGEPRRDDAGLIEIQQELSRCIDSSVNALQVASHLLTRIPTTISTDGAASPRTVNPTAQTRLWTRPRWFSPAHGLMLVGSVAAGVALMAGLTNGRGLAPYTTVAAAVPASGTEAHGNTAGAGAAETRIAGIPVEAAAEQATASPAADATVAELSPALPVSEGLVLTLTATSECWIRTTIDAGEPRERLLAAGERITLRADHSATLRVGDPAALVLEINGQPARPLGRAGRAVTAEVTAANYRTFVSSN